MRERIQEAFVDELEKMGFLASQVARLGTSKAARAAAGKAMSTTPRTAPKQGLIGKLAKNQTLRNVGSGLAQGAMFMAPSALMSRQPKEKPAPVTSGLG